MVTITRIAMAALVAAFSVLPEISAAQTETTAREAAATRASDSAEARAHLVQARQTLADLTKLPAAVELTGEARGQVVNVIKHFNQLITSKTDWTTDFVQVRDTLDRLLGQAPAPTESDRPVGTTGNAGITLDPVVASKLRELRSQLMAFYAASGSPPLGPGSMTVPQASPPPRPAPPSPEAPATEPVPPEQPVQATGTTAPSPAATFGAGSASARLADLAKIVDEVLAVGSGGSVAIDRSTLEAMKMHIDQLRTLLAEGR